MAEIEVDTLVDETTVATGTEFIGVGPAGWQTIPEDVLVAHVVATLGTAAAADTGDFDAAGAAASAQAASQPVDSDLTAIAALTTTAFGRGVLALADAAALRTAAGVGTIATQAASGVAITGGTVTGITDLAVADGGTGGSTASAARTNLGLAIGTDVQAFDTDLAAIAALTTTAFGRGLLVLADAAALQTLAAMSAAQILAALVTVDGDGSGLDADTVKGVDATPFVVTGTPTVGQFPAVTSTGPTVIGWSDPAGGAQIVPWAHMGNVTAPDGTGTGNAPAAPEAVVSSGTQTANTPKPTYMQWLFDQSTDEHILCSGRLPSNWASGLTLTVRVGAKATSGNVVLKAGIVAGEPSSTDMDAAVFIAADLSTATAVPGTIGHFVDIPITLTTTGLSAGDHIVLFIGRDADNAADTLAADMTLRSFELSYTAA